MSLDNPPWAAAMVSFIAVAIGQFLRRLGRERPEDRRQGNTPDRAEAAHSLSYRLGYLWARRQQMGNRSLP